MVIRALPSEFHLPSLATILEGLPLPQNAAAMLALVESVSWAVILLSVVLGMVVALRPAKREDTVKKPRV